MKKHRFIVSAKHSHIHDFFDLIDVYAKDFSGERRKEIKLVFEEVFVNIVDYAYRRDERCSVYVSFTKKKNTLGILFADKGVYFNPLLKEDPDTENITEPGGFGVFLIKKLSDECRYRRLLGRNVLTVIFQKNIR